MAIASHWGLSPQQSIEAECARRGKSAVITGCIDVLAGDYTDLGLIMSLGGPAAAKYFDGRLHTDEYWFRVWAIRGLLWAWEDNAAHAVNLALRDESWRVREMAAKVVARHVVGDALSTVVELRDDPVPRVRAAAERAVRVLAQGRCMTHPSGGYAVGPMRACPNGAGAAGGNRTSGFSAWITFVVKGSTAPRGLRTVARSPDMSAQLLSLLDRPRANAGVDGHTGRPNPIRAFRGSNIV